MSKIKWIKDFSVQNKDIDNQHKKFIQIYNKAHDQMLNYDEVDDMSGLI
ncbi:MAG: hypothetical protein H8D87_02895 [Deltaproteobacteria bacterium]|nr:hypothetical protein [Candidatus Desulfobacula maris]MBL6996174.1 hypothetical protein [Desulfobacula sp.]